MVIFHVCIMWSKWWYCTSKFRLNCVSAQLEMFGHRFYSMSTSFLFLIACCDVMSSGNVPWPQIMLKSPVLMCWCVDVHVAMNVSTYVCIFAVLYLWLCVYMMHVMKASIHLHKFQCIPVRNIPSTSLILQTLKLNEQGKRILGCLGCKGGYTTLCYRLYYILLWESLLNSQYNEK